MSEPINAIVLLLLKRSANLYVVTTKNKVINAAGSRMAVRLFNPKIAPEMAVSHVGSGGFW